MAFRPDRGERISPPSSPPTGSEPMLARSELPLRPVLPGSRAHRSPEPWIRGLRVASGHCPVGDGPTSSPGPIPPCLPGAPGRPCASPAQRGDASKGRPEVPGRGGRKMSPAWVGSLPASSGCCLQTRPRRCLPLGRLPRPHGRRSAVPPPGLPPDRAGRRGAAW